MTKLTTTHLVRQVIGWPQFRIDTCVHNGNLPSDPEVSVWRVVSYDEFRTQIAPQWLAGDQSGPERFMWGGTVYPIGAEYYEEVFGYSCFDCGRSPFNKYGPTIKMPINQTGAHIGYPLCPRCLTEHQKLNRVDDSMSTSSIVASQAA